MSPGRVPTSHSIGTLWNPNPGWLGDPLTLTGFPCLNLALKSTVPSGSVAPWKLRVPAAVVAGNASATSKLAQTSARFTASSRGQRPCFARQWVLPVAQLVAPPPKSPETRRMPRAFWS